MARARARPEWMTTRWCRQVRLGCRHAILPGRMRSRSHFQCSVSNGSRASTPSLTRKSALLFFSAEEHNRAYLQEVLDYFLRERAEPFAAGAVPYPLGEWRQGGGWRS